MTSQINSTKTILIVGHVDDEIRELFDNKFKEVTIRYSSNLNGVSAWDFAAADVRILAIRSDAPNSEQLLGLTTDFKKYFLPFGETGVAYFRVKNGHPIEESEVIWF